MTGHTSAVIASENSINYSLRVIKPLLDGKGTTAEVSLDAEKRYVEDMQQALSRRVIAQGCSNWYVFKLPNGKTWNAQIYPWTQAHYWYRCLFPVWKDWQFRVSLNTYPASWSASQPHAHAPCEQGPFQAKTRAGLGRLVLSAGLAGALLWLLLTRKGSNRLKMLMAYAYRYQSLLRQNIARLKSVR